MKLKNEHFVHWHVHSELSAFDGLSKISKVLVKDKDGTDVSDDNLVLKARKMGFPAMAITDHGVVSGWIKFIKACTATKDREGNDIPWKPITPILGCEFYLSRNHEFKNKQLQPDGRRGNRHLNVYARNWAGYQNLCALSEKSWIDGFYSNPRIDLDLLDKHSDGLSVGSACLSSLVNANLLHGRYEKAKKTVSVFKDIFGENFFLEAMFHGISEEGQILPDIFKLSADMGVPVIATNDCHYVNKQDAKSQEVLMCMSTSNCLTNPKHIRHPYGEFHLKSADEMGQIFGGVPQALLNSYGMLERINFEDINSNLFGGMRLPKYELPEGFNTPMEYLEHLAMDGMHRIGWGNSKPHLDRLKIELDDVRVALDINKYDFATYFLIVWDYMNYARSKGIITGCGRGSGYSSILLRALGITYGVDPLKYGLLWERFLGFDWKRFIKESDFGLRDKIDILEPSEIDTDRDYEDDAGGTDRY